MRFQHPEVAAGNDDRRCHDDRNDLRRTHEPSAEAEGQVLLSQRGPNHEHEEHRDNRVEPLNADRSMGQEQQPEAKEALRALTSVRLADFTTLGRISPAGRREKLDELLAGLEADLPLFAEQLTLSYLAHAEPSVSLGSLEDKGV